MGMGVLPSLRISPLRSHCQRAPLPPRCLRAALQGQGARLHHWLRFEQPSRNENRDRHGKDVRLVVGDLVHTAPQLQDILIHLSTTELVMNPVYLR